MLAIATGKIDMSRAKLWSRQMVQAGALVRNEKSHPNYSLDGVYGDPTHAPKENASYSLKR
ncbi:MAG TPA: hypothetical protein VK460_04450 [Burkholderiales bacterium]|nr:hypothetical protein [Burkholderiales bacterium]